MLVHFLTTHTYKAYCVTYPLRVFSKQIKGIGIDVKFFHRQSASLLDCDVLILGTEVFGKRRVKLEPSNRNEFLKSIRASAKTIIWLDMTDGTGTTWFGVLPYVDLYAKTQLLKDRSLYFKQLYSGRYNSKYYHERFGVEDIYQYGTRETLKPDELNKLALFWNLGLGDNHANTTWRRRLRTIFSIARNQYKFTPSSQPRRIDVSYRASDHSNLATVAFQRKETREHLTQFATETGKIVQWEGKLSYFEYLRELSQAAIVASPFGLGETCPRDYDCFLAGAALFKPDMDHLETWPDYYESGVTYMPFAWDFSDFEEKLLYLLDSQEKRLQIAQTGQERYLHSLSPAGGDEFAEHFSRLLETAVNNSIL